ncbi:MAG TPA: TIGR04552 family protein [Nitrospirota bacterium]|nr:TIGR04552 family protein [Nitrospirota bacterium]
MSQKRPHSREETFEEYRDRHNIHADETAFLRSFGLTEPQEDEKKTKSIREEVADKIALALDPVDQILKGTGHNDQKPTSKLREVLLANLAPFLKKDKPEISMMDLSTLGLTDESKIRRFLDRHGIDLDKPDNLEYTLRVLREAVAFYDEEIACINSRKVSPRTAAVHPHLRKFANAHDVYNVFKVAAGHGIRHLTPQACALLRIAMVIDFMEKDPHIAATQPVKDELKSKLLQNVRKVGNSSLYHSGNPQEKPIPLVSAVVRFKERERIIMKLLHKPSNSTSEVLDHIGGRFVTESASDALRLIYQMFFDSNFATLPFMNIRIGKTKQSLIDPKLLMEALKDAKKAEKLFAELSEVTINHQEVQTESLTGTENPHSSENYQAIHITFDFPMMVNGNPMFIPIEIQVVDKTAHMENDVRASHPDYIEKQRKAATARALGNNLQTNYQTRKKNGNGKKKHA